MSLHPARRGPRGRDEEYSVECGAKTRRPVRASSTAASFRRRFHFILCCLCRRQAIKLSCLLQHASAISPRRLYLRFLLGPASLQRPQIDCVLVFWSMCKLLFFFFYLFCLYGQRIPENKCLVYFSLTLPPAEVPHGRFISCMFKLNIQK